MAERMRPRVMRLSKNKHVEGHSIPYTGDVYTVEQALQDRYVPYVPFVAHLLRMEPRIRMYTGYTQKANSYHTYIPTKQYIYLPHSDGLPWIAHQIGHMVEMQDEKRWVLPDWGLPVPSDNWEKKMTTAHLVRAVARESRVRAIQAMMQPSYSTDLFNNPYWEGFVRDKIVGYNQQVVKFTQRLDKIQADASMVQVHKGAAGYGRFKTFEDVRDWARTIREQTERTWDLDRVEGEWKTRLAYIQNWMETRENDT